MTGTDLAVPEVVDGELVGNSNLFGTADPPVPSDGTRSELDA